MKQEVPTDVTTPQSHKKPLLSHLPTIGWFLFGGILGLFFFISFVFIYFKLTYSDVVYPGVFIDGVDFGGKAKETVKDYFSKKNIAIERSQFILRDGDMVASISAKELNMGYDDALLSEQAYMIGRSDNTLSNISLIFQSYMQGVYLEPSYRMTEDRFKEITEPYKEAINREPVDAQFSIQNGKVAEFQPSKNGEKVDEAKLKSTLETKMYVLLQGQKSDTITIDVPTIVVEPKVTTEKANNLGIRELIATGTSLFQGSIPNRIYNLTLASSRINGAIVQPGETFSFNKTIGDISKLTGYKEAYVIQGGRTVLGDGGGVCQVSTTLFRAVINAGLPITERNQHAYRVGYYEQDSSPGVDAAIYTPNVDFKFKNDTKHHILIQSYVNPDEARLTFELYGTKDNREVVVNDPVITSQTPAPEPVYQDDPNLPKDQIKQIDFAAPGATVYFTRIVKRDGKVIYEDKFTSRYRPWQAVFLKGTKEG